MVAGLGLRGANPGAGPRAKPDTQSLASDFSMPAEITFPAARAAGLARLKAFLPRAGRAYAQDRNFDFGPGRRENVSGLSPYLRHRLLTEEEVLIATLAQHSPQQAEKFIQEVFWRSYWKGWLELRPSAWHDYWSDLETILTELEQDQELSHRYRDAIAARTGIDCFDAWAAELCTEGYLHNHSRMWFASIWIFTLGLPWQLGADFFMRHLLDGDPASNTLSWRWVAGLQTRGKHYLARADNIRRYTANRFDAQGQLNEAASAPEAPAHPPANDPPTMLPPDSAEDVALLLTEDDLHPESLDIGPSRVRAIAGLSCPHGRSPQGVSSQVEAFIAAAMKESMSRAAEHFQAELPAPIDPADLSALVATIAASGVNTVLHAYAPTGAVRQRLADLGSQLEPLGIRLTPVLRDWDRRCWPHARRGFFAFRQKIPSLLPT
jgi:deoxyribodipyrimidine photo-lyase